MNSTEKTTENDLITYRKWAMSHVAFLLEWFVKKNPRSSPASQQREYKRLIKHFGLKNKYLPPDFKKETNDNSDAGRTEDPAISGS